MPSRDTSNCQANRLRNRVARFRRNHHNGCGGVLFCLCAQERLGVCAIATDREQRNDAMNFAKNNKFTTVETWGPDTIDRRVGGAQNAPDAAQNFPK
jgi:hypothetical protein